MATKFEHAEVKIVSVENANAVTHGGVFHGDDVFATALLSYFMEEVCIARVFKLVEEDVWEDAIVFDVGGVFDPITNWFDHHQKDFWAYHADGTKYSSFGLIWQYYGFKILEKIGVEEELREPVFKMVDKNLVIGVDAQDNGQITQSNPQSMSVSNAITLFNTNWDDEFSPDVAFLDAVKFAQTILDNQFRSAIAKARAKARVEQAIEEANDGIMYLDKFMPWQGILSASKNPKAEEVLYVVFPSIRGGYNAQGVRIIPSEYNLRKPLPKDWAGLSRDDLVAKTGVEDATFCHTARFICGASTLDGAMALARLAIAS